MNIITNNDLLKYVQENPSVSFSIDRFEENFAVCENKSTEDMILLSLDLIPKEAKTGDILVIQNNTLVIDIKSTQKEQQEIKNLVNQLFKRKS